MKFSLKLQCIFCVCTQKTMELVAPCPNPLLILPSKFQRSNGGVHQRKGNGGGGGGVGVLGSSIYF